MPPRCQKDSKRAGISGQQFQIGRRGGDKGDFPAGVLDGGEGIAGLGVLQPNRIHGLAQLLVRDDGGDFGVFQLVVRAAADQVEQQVLRHWVHGELASEVKLAEIHHAAAHRHFDQRRVFEPRAALDEALAAARGLHIGVAEHQVG